MGRRMMAIVVAVGVAGALVAGGVLVASRSAKHEPAALLGLRVEDDQGAVAAAGAADAQVTPRGTTPGTPSYQVRGKLPELPRSARAWTLDQRVTSETVAALAADLGLAGTPRQEALAWTVTDGTRVLRVTRTPGLPWTFGTARSICGGPLPSGAAPKGIPCAVGPDLSIAPPARGRPAPGTSVPGTSVRIVPPQRVPLPDQARAERIARDLLSRLGVQADGAELRATRAIDRWLVLVAPQVGGMPTSAFSWTVGIGAKGRIVSASGWLAAPRPGDTYPLITVQQALDRLRQRRLPGPLITTGPPQPLPSPVRPECRRTEEATVCSVPRIPSTITVTDVRLGLQLASVLPPGGGGQRVDLLVPAYFFQLEGTWTRQVTVVAVQDRFLDMPTAPTAVPQRSKSDSTITETSRRGARGSEGGG
jgi:hypothetical protein